MLSVSDLSAEQVEQIKAWVADGEQMADLQRRLKEDFGFNVTYMDTRFLALDLGLDFYTEPEAEPEAEEGTIEAEVMDAPPEAASALDPAPAPAGMPAGPVTVGLDQVAIPGSMVSGTVTFSDGEKGRWMIDEMGRPSLDVETEGYSPAQSDLESFQVELRKLLEKPM